jgi:hypothetical protein
MMVPHLTAESAVRAEFFVFSVILACSAVNKKARTMKSGPQFESYE